ncbi:MAG: hypothetical protein HQK96_11135 [Nitrospirae bacterium]|nr:hypothetical protein [Nitrospirota bacterium]
MMTNSADIDWVGKATDLFSNRVLDDYLERICILEYDAGLTREVAEREGYRLMLEKYGDTAFKVR